MLLSARAEGPRLVCTLISDRPVTAPTLCLSAMVPVDVETGGTRTRSVGGYVEIVLPDLTPDRPHTVTLKSEVEAFHHTNRAWLPQGVYLRTDGGLVTVGLDHDLGVRLQERLAQTRPKGLGLVPEPADWAPDGGSIAAGLSAHHAAFRAVDALARRTGLDPLFAANGIPVEIQDDPDLASESHRIVIAPGSVHITAADTAGVFYAGITLLTLATTHGGQIPCGTITDGPRFSWRGQHLDCARHFYDPSAIHRLLDLMALLKLNKFHWHFADDEAFRIPLPNLPDLAKATALRGEGQLLPGLFGGGIRSGGSYSRQEIDAILAHAAELQIEVMPEIEVPAHALALAKVYPGTRDPDDTGTERSVQGYEENVVNPAMSETWHILETMVRDIAGMFPGDHLHLGCDELPEDTWMGSPKARELMQSLGLRTTKDLQGWTINRLARTVTELGKTPAAWEEAAQGATGIENGALLFSWTGQGPGLDAARQGYDVVMCPAQHVYFDMAHSDDPDDWGASWAAFIALRDTVAWDPVPKDEPELEGRIKGVQGAFWSEFTTRDAQMQPMLAPRILGLSMMAWQARGTADPDRLSHMAQVYQTLFDRMGWRHAPA